MVPAARRLGAVSLAVIVASSPALAVTAIPEIVVTPYYTPTPRDQVGSSVTVVGRQAIARTSATTVAQLLRTVPGVTVIESGGAGGNTEVRLRGAETGHTVVLIDGVRVNDASSARGDFDFTLLSLNDVERVEILRGPQSAIYGSDAMGGVVNIITRRQTRKPSLTATVEGGSYGTLNESAAGGMTAGDFALRFSGAHVYSNGFSRRGNRDTNEPDGLDRYTGSGRIVYAPAGGVKVEVGGTATHELTKYDAASGANQGEALNTTDRTEVSGSGKVTLPQWDGWLTQSVSAFGALSRRLNTEPTGAPSLSTFDSMSVGGEYQAVADLSAAGTLTGGARIETVHAANVASGGGFAGYNSDRTYYAGYLQHQFTLRDALHFTLASRYDGEVNGDGFLTGRASAAYEIPSWGTVLRSSIGTGAKRPTPYQIGTNLAAGASADLRPEQSVGVDAGIEQTLFGGALHVSATGFYNQFRDLITFPSTYYENVDRAETHGLELAVDAQIWPDTLSASATYTWMPTRNLLTGAPLPRRAEHSASFTVTWTPEPGWELALTGTAVGKRTNSASSPTLLPSYFRLDASFSHAVSDRTKIFGRIENLTNNVYTDPSGYNAAGLSAYVGLTWNR
ncbi:MAG TPA: TonB-dependent receptor [Bauldia sp.]|nr:TonB-dependent receptor [Bauldia sp.]